MYGTHTYVHISLFLSLSLLSPSLPIVALMSEQYLSLSLHVFFLFFFVFFARKFDRFILFYFFSPYFSYIYLLTAIGTLYTFPWRRKWITVFIYLFRIYRHIHTYILYIYICIYIIYIYIYIYIAYIHMHVRYTHVRTHIHLSLSLSLPLSLRGWRVLSLSLPTYFLYFGK